MAMIPGFTNLEDIRRIARSRADMTNSPYVTNQDWADYINLAASNMYDLLIEKYGEMYFATQYIFTSDGTNQQYTLPQDFYKKLGLDMQWAGGPMGWLTVQNFMFPERNKYTNYAIGPNLWYWNLRALIMGGNVFFSPIPIGGVKFRLWYAPRMPLLSDYGTLTLNSVQVGDTFTINPAYTASIQNPDGTTIVSPGGTPVVFTCVASGATGTQFNLVVGDMITTAVNLTNAINASTLNTTYGIVAQVQTGLPSLLVIPPTSGMTLSWAGSSPHFQLSLPLVWGNQFDSINGWHKLVILDAAIAAKVKEESDVSALMAERQIEVARIEAAAATRSPDQPNTVSNTQSRGGWGFGSDLGSGGSGYGWY